MSKTQKTLIHTLIYMAGLIANRGIAFLLIPFYTRVLEPGTFAKLDLCITTVIFLIPLFEMAMGSALVRFYHFAADTAQRERVVATSFTFVSLSVVMFSVLGYFLANPIAHVIFGDADNIELVYLIIITIAVTALGNQVLSLLRAQDKSVHFAILNLVRALVGPVVIIYLVIHQDMGLSGVLVGDILGLTAMLVIGMLITRKWVRIQLSVVDLKQMIPFALPLIPWALANSIITLSDRYFLRAWVGYEELAVYSLGFKIGMIMTLFTRAFQTAWPSSAYSIAKEENAYDTFYDIFRYTSVTLLSVAALLSLASPLGINYFTGNEAYEAGYWYVPLVTASYVLNLVVLFILTGVTISTNTKGIFIIVVFSGIIKILFNILFIPTIGIVGAPLATLFAFILQLIMANKLTQKINNFNFPIYRLCAMVLWGNFVVYTFYYLYSDIVVVSVLLAGLALLGIVGAYFLLGFMRVTEVKFLLKRFLLS